MEVTAKLRRLRMAPRKIRLVAGLIRRMPVRQAETQLKFLNKAAARPMLKLLQSAIANAENNFKLNVDDLWINHLMVDGGMTIKRFRPRAHGRAGMIRKRTSHITLILSDDKREPVKTKKSYTPRSSKKVVSKPAVKKEVKSEKTENIES
ncbi:50S ribosomal protein L22 [Patescibacteria group bacterium]|nr:50S ribosomal protein L22 [Patescibacteria group bacterium]